MLKNIRVPTLLAIILILSGIFTTNLLLQKKTSFLTKANPRIYPKKVRITNLSDTRFTISFVTEEPTISFLSYGPSKNLGNIVQDDRDSLSGKTTPSITHYLTLSNLRPDTVYYFKIGVDKKLYGAPNSKNSKISMSCLDFLEVVPNGEPFSIKTLPSKMISCRDIPLNGEVINAQKLPAFGSVVCVEIENLLPISDYVKINGKWVIPCYNLTLSNLADFEKTLSSGKKETIYITTGINEDVKIINKTGNDNPVPLIILGKNFYDFSQVTPTQEPISDQKALPLPTLSPLVTLIYPQGSITDNLPTFRGKGKAGQVLKIEVRANTNKSLKATVVIDKNGNWSWTPPETLSEGTHNVSIQTTDEYGNQQIITKVFTISGRNTLLPISSGTQSANLDKAPTTKPSPSPTRAPTITPSLTYSPSPTPTYFLEEISPSPIATQSQTLMDTANEIPIVILLTFAFISFTLGLRLIF